MSDNREYEIDDFDDEWHFNPAGFIGQTNTAGTAATGNTPTGSSGTLSDDDYLEYVYQAALGRSSDQDGKTHWLQELHEGHIDRDSLMEAFENSQEGLEHAASASTTTTSTATTSTTADTTATGNTTTLSDDDYLEYVYQAALGRNSDQGGKTHWLQELHEGHIDRDSLMEAFRNSQEGLEHASLPNGINSSPASEEHLSLIGVSTVSLDAALFG